MNPAKPLRLWHGSDTTTDTLDPAKTVCGGLHVGTKEQATMRNSRVLYEIEFTPGNVRRCIDRGGNWKQKVRDAKNRGFDTIVYLNRFEGMTTERVTTMPINDLLWLESCSDVVAKKLFPEAKDSYVLLPGTEFKIVSRIVAKKKKKAATA